MSDGKQLNEDDYGECKPVAVIPYLPPRSKM